MVIGRQEVNTDNASQLDFYPHEIIKIISEPIHIFQPCPVADYYSLWHCNRTRIIEGRPALECICKNHLSIFGRSSLKEFSYIAKVCLSFKF